MCNVKFLRDLLEKHLSQEVELIPMKGGINNEVFFCSTCSPKKKILVVKVFSKEKSNVKERMKAETIFLNYVCFVN